MSALTPETDGCLKSIVHICESFAYGAAKSVSLLAKLMADRGYRVIVYYGLRDGTDFEDQDPAIEWRVLRGRGRFRHLSNLFQLRRELSELLSGTDTILHGQSSYGGLYAKLLGRWSNTPVLYSPRGYSFLRKDKSSLSRRLFRFTEKKTSAMCKTIACGPYEYSIAKTLSEDSALICNSIEIRESRNRPDIGQGFIGAGRICYQKGFDIFKEIARRNSSMAFTWFGEPDDRWHSLLDDCPPNLSLPGFVGQADLHRELLQCRAVCFPSRWEGLSRFLIEAIAHGKPVICSTFPGNLDCLKSDLGGGYANGFACRTLADYDAAITTLLDDMRVVEMQRQSLELARTRFSREVADRLWIETYEAAFARHGAASESRRG